MSDFDYLKRMLKEYTHVLELRKNAIKKGNRYAGKLYGRERLRRLRIEIQSCMLKIERECGGFMMSDEPFEEVY